MYEKFLNDKINAAFPCAYFFGNTLQDLVDQYGEPALDGNRLIPTLYCRQDTQDINSRRAAGTSNESPLLLTNNRMLIIDIFPSLKIMTAIENGDLPDIEIVSDVDLTQFILDNKLPNESEV